MGFWVTALLLSTPEQLPKSPHSDHNMEDKNTIEQSTEQCKHPEEGAHIHVVEQVRPQGMKKQWTKQRNTSQQQKLQENFTRQYRATIQRAIPVKKKQKNTTILIKYKK